MLDLENVKAEATSAETAPRCTEIAALPCRNETEIDTEVALGLDRDGTDSDGADVSPRLRRDGTVTGLRQHRAGNGMGPRKLRWHWMAWRWHQDGTEKAEMALDGVEMATRWHRDS